MASHDPKDLVAMREAAGWTQYTAANQLGMSLRAYQAIEAGESAYREVHKLALERVLMVSAVLRGKPMVAPPVVRQDALDLVALIRGEPLPPRTS